MQTFLNTKYEKCIIYLLQIKLISYLFIFIYIFVIFHVLSSTVQRFKSNLSNKKKKSE